MIIRRGPIGIGDALTAARQLGMEADDDLAMITELLGLAGAAPAAEERRPGRPKALRVRPVAQDTTTTEPPTGHESAAALQTVVETLTPEPVAPIAYERADTLTPGSAGSGIVAYEPIVPPHQLRAAMTRIIRRPRPSVEPDVNAAVELIAEQRPLEELPRLIEHTVDAGVRIIADIGPGMLPYLADADHLVGAARSVAGRSTTVVAWVRDADDLGPMPDDRPIMIISTLGAADAPDDLPGTELRWQHWARTLIAPSADVVAVVPHRRLRWPQVPRLRFVPWDDLSEVGRGRD